MKLFAINSFESFSLTALQRFDRIFISTREIADIAKEDQTTISVITRQYCKDLASKGFIFFDGKKARRLEG
jgi:hypothetical protein